MFWGSDITKMPYSWRQCVTMFTEELPWLPERDKELIMGPGRVRLVGVELSVNRGRSAMTQAPQLRALSAALGTEALGIDLSKPLEAETLAWIHAAFAEHPVLVFRGQDLGE